MRIASTIYQDDALYYMQQLQTALSRTQSELSTGKQLQSAADNPAGMADANQLSAQLSASQQYTVNGNAASTGLQLEAQALADATNVLQSARTLAVQANNSTLSATNRQSIALQLQQQLQDLIAIANRTDGSGKYLFSGYAEGTRPFTPTAGGVAYNGAQSVRQIQISLSRLVPAGDTGDAVFMNVPGGNGTFKTAAGAANTGNGSIDGGAVINAAAWVPDTYTISFTSPTQYQVTNSASTVVASGSLMSGQAIAFNGVQVSISGNPATGDTFSVSPAGKASVFSTLAGLVATLTSSSGNGQRATQVGGAIQQIDNALNQLANVQAAVGARLNTVSAAQSSAQSQQTTLQGVISKITDTDYAAAVTQLSTEQIGLQAAQQSYSMIARLSLFNYLRGM